MIKTHAPQPRHDFIGDLCRSIGEFLSWLDGQEMLHVLSTVEGRVRSELDRAVELEKQRDALFSRIEAADYPELARLHDDLNALEMDRFLAIPSVTALNGSCTEYRDLLAERTLLMVEQEMPSPPPLPFALLSMGSDGRKEQTLITDQDYLLVYDDGGGEECDAYFADFSRVLVERLAEIGFKKCTGDMMPSNPTWRGSLSQWKRRITSIVRYEFDDYARNLMDLIVLSDARYVAGNATLAATLTETIRDLEQEYFQVLWGMAKAATEMKIAIGFLKRFWTEGSGEHKGEFNLKLLGWAPLIMNVRILAINAGVPATNTLERIELLQRENSFSATMATGLAEAYHVLTRHRALLQIKQIKGIQKESYYLNPYRLPAEEREDLRQALLRIEDLQKTIHVNFSIM